MRPIYLLLILPVLAVAVAVAVFLFDSSEGKVVVVSHGPPTLVYVDLGDPGPGVGDVYHANVPARGPDGEEARLVGTLTTVAADVPAEGQEIRTSKLVFLFADPSDQIEIGGASTYSSVAQVRPRRSETIRPIVGGSGIYAGASGWAESIHFGDGNWEHRLHLDG